MTRAYSQRWRSYLLAAVAIWLLLAGWAFWMHRRPPVADVILSPLPGWQVQVWFGAQRTIAQRLGQQRSAAVPIVMVFYKTPGAGPHLLVRGTLPAWPLVFAAGTLVGVALLVLGGPAVTRWRTWRQVHCLPRPGARSERLGASSRE